MGKTWIERTKGTKGVITNLQKRRSEEEMSKNGEEMLEEEWQYGKEMVEEE